MGIFAMVGLVGVRGLDGLAAESRCTAEMLAQIFAGSFASRILSDILFAGADAVGATAGSDTVGGGLCGRAE